jgi:glycosyltransferase involved in cell wall biosynthesis
VKILCLCPDPGIPVLGHKGASVHVRELIGAFARAGHRVTLAAQTLVKSPAHKPARIRARVVHIPSGPAFETAERALKDFNSRFGIKSSLPGELRRIAYNDVFYRELKRRFLRHKPDFIYERASLYATAGVELAAKFKIPHIVEVNAPLTLEQSTYRATGFAELAAKAEVWMLTRADVVLAVSTALARHVRGLGVPAKNIHIIPNGVNPELFCSNARKSMNTDASITKDVAPRPVLGFVGSLRPWHGVEVLPRLLSRLCRNYPNVRMIIVGDGQLRGELEREFRKRKLIKMVHFTGALLHDEIPAWIRKFDIALAPYPKHDHDFYFSPLKLFEYMACGVAVVASDVGQITEVVRNGKTGLLYPAGNFIALASACEKLLVNSSLRASLGIAAAKEIGKRFTWNINAAKTVRLAEKLRHALRNKS